MSSLLIFFLGCVVGAVMVWVCISLKGWVEPIKYEDPISGRAMLKLCYKCDGKPDLFLHVPRFCIRETIAIGNRVAVLVPAVDSSGHLLMTERGGIKHENLILRVAGVNRSHKGATEITLGSPGRDVFDSLKYAGWHMEWSVLASE